MFTRKSKIRRGEDGMTMIELVIPMVVLAIGLGGTMIMISGSITSNNRNKMDTTATTLSEMVMERIIAAGVGASGTFTIKDCAGTTITIDPTGSSAGRGAAVDGTTGNISFTTAANPSSGYTMNYVTCGVNGSQATYDVRWRVVNTQASASAVYAKMVTVSARQIAGSSSNSLVRFFAPPVTLKTLVTN
jgi:Tfp pilus assembly protein PilV